MACCILTAVIMSQLIRACDALHIRFFQIRYNDDEGDACAPADTQDKTTSETCQISINGMTCGVCSSNIIQQLEKLDGVHRAGVSLTLGRATVSYDALTTTSAEIVKAVQKTGYDATLGGQSLHDTIERLRQSRELLELRKSISSAIICLMIVIGFEYMPFLAVANKMASRIDRILTSLSLLLALKVQILDAWPIHFKAWGSYGRRITMDTLLSLSLLVGLELAMLQVWLQRPQSTITYASSGCFLTVIMLAGRYLEAVLKRESNSNLAALYELQTEKETYPVISRNIDVPASLLRKGDDVLIRPQATIPCDCFIIEGSSAFNESTITGEPLPVIKKVGDFLIAGSRNISSEVRVIISRDQSRSSLAKVIEGVTAATEQRLDGVEPLDVVMNYFVYGVVCLAVAAFSATMWRRRMVTFEDCFVTACERAATVLAAACPCGIGLATPSAAMAGIDIAYSQGILLCGGIRTMQTLSKTTHVVMDKTGTLTQGRLEVVSHHFHDDLRLNRRLCYRLLAAAEMEEARVHPVAKAVFKWALSHAQQTNSKQTVGETRNLARILGMGVTCETKVHLNEWVTVHIGRASLLEEDDIVVPPLHDVERSDVSIVHFAFDNRYAGYIFVQDTVRPEASSVVMSLLRSGQQVTLLTGDTSREAKRISEDLGIRVLASSALPEDKMQHIKQLQQQGHCVAMVGDGINDALAQAAADVGISISLTQGCFTGAGSVVVVSGNLQSLVALFSISKKVVRQAKLNIRWALVYNAIAMSLALRLWEHWGLSVSASFAGTLMAGNSASVLSMSLWLRWRLRNQRLKH